MKKKERISEREYRGRLDSLLKSAFNTQLQPLKSLETAKAQSVEKEGRRNFWVHEIKHDSFRLMVRPTSAFYEMTLVGGTLAIGLRESRSGCCIVDDTGEVDTRPRDRPLRSGPLYPR